MPHEHRRELRALKVFGAWTNLVDMKAGNTLDVLITENGKSVVRHYLQDVGSTFGTGANAVRDTTKAGSTSSTAASSGSGWSPWASICSPGRRSHYVDNDSIGRFEGTSSIRRSGSRGCRPPRFATRAADDTFWAARRVMAFSDEMIRAIAETGRYHDESAARSCSPTS